MFQYPSEPKHTITYLCKKKKKMVQINIATYFDIEVELN